MGLPRIPHGRSQIDNTGEVLISVLTSSQRSTTTSESVRRLSSLRGVGFALAA